jgi:hypothetical protein
MVMSPKSLALEVHGGYHFFQPGQTEHFFVLLGLKRRGHAYKSLKQAFFGILRQFLLTLGNFVQFSLFLTIFG